jgi:predicted metal-dependent phosphoesterase TrpH
VTVWVPRPSDLTADSSFVGVVRKNEASSAPSPSVFAVDLHTHSRFFHLGRGPTRYDPVGLRANAFVARRRGLDAFAVTNHDYRYTAETSLPTLPGVEVSTTLGHVLVVGPDPPVRTTPGALTPAQAVELAHDRGCAAILAHPYRNSAARRSDAAFDAVELNGKNPEHVRQTRRLAARLDCPLVGGSDAHYPFEVGRAFTRIDADELTPSAVAAAIRAGDVEPVVDLGRIHRVLDRAYTQLHERKGWMDVVDDGGTRT